MTRPERIAALAALLLAGCASPRVPEQLPHYPCQDAKGAYYACSADEWLHQELLRRPSK